MTLEVTFERISRVYLLFAKLKRYCLQVQLTPNTPISINYLPTLGPLVQWLTPCHYQLPHVFTSSLNQQIFQDLIHKTSSPSSLSPFIALTWQNFKLGWIQYFIYFIHQKAAKSLVQPLPFCSLQSISEAFSIRAFALAVSLFLRFLPQNVSISFWLLLEYYLIWNILLDTLYKIARTSSSPLSTSIPCYFST